MGWRLRLPLLPSCGSEAEDAALGSIFLSGLFGAADNVCGEAEAFWIRADLLWRWPVSSRQSGLLRTGSITQAWEWSCCKGHVAANILRE